MATSSNSTIQQSNTTTELSKLLATVCNNNNQPQNGLTSSYITQQNLHALISSQLLQLMQQQQQNGLETKLTQQLNINSNNFNDSVFPLLTDSIRGNTSSSSLFISNSTNNFEKTSLNNGNKLLEAYAIYRV